MAAKKTKNSTKGKDKTIPSNQKGLTTQLGKGAPKELEKKLDEMKKKLDVFQKKLLGKFDNYIMGLALLPPEMPKKNAQGMPPQQTLKKGEVKEEQTLHMKKDEVKILVLIDDTDSKKMSKYELKDKLTVVIKEMATAVDKKIIPEVIILSELWQNCYDAKYDLLPIVAMSAIIYDKGMLAAVKIAEVHKTMVLRKFEKYIVSYVLAGSLVQGKATKTSDIDVWIVIDDTDVKKMTRVELKDKLRAIIIGMGIEAGEITGIKNKLNIQVYILTDFWDSLKEANPVIFTLLRDGIPFYDRGMFMPWKQLLKMGRIKPSPEAIDLFMSSGEQMLKKVERTIKSIGMDDTFWAILTPSQAALMLYGIPPPTPKETPKLMKDIFVKKEKILELEYVEILEKNIKVRKDLEHGTKKTLTGKEVDTLVTNAGKYLKRIKKLFDQIDIKKKQEGMIHLYETVITIIRDTLRMEGIERAKDIEIVKIFEDELIAVGKIPAKYLRILNDVVKAKKDYDNNKLTQQEVNKVNRKGNDLIKFLVEYMQRKRGRELDRAKIRVKHGKKYGEVLLLDKVAFIIHDVEKRGEGITKAQIGAKGRLTKAKESNLEELEVELAKVNLPGKVFIKESIFEDLKEFFGKDVEFLLNY
ncbi:MAG: nucleotidyltransferase domain-containing protein [Nanoarchaeota archaeon]|nr:nucleotidyltransferase domain-containing protein [Nanoarchaeota archaeon]